MIKSERNKGRHPVAIGREAWRECANAHRWAVEVRSETEEKR